MPKINILEFGLDIAHAIRERDPSRHIAVLMKQIQGKAPRIVGVGAHPISLDDWSTHTAIVNAIQGIEPKTTGLGNLLVLAPTRRRMPVVA